MKKLIRLPFTLFFSFSVFMFLCLSFLITETEASIVMKLVAANPSKNQVQKVSIKTYLPKETKPEDILEKSDLEVTYDTQQGSYYVYGEYELKPGEMIEKDIELKDIWIIPSSEIESLRQEAVKLAGGLKNTEFAERTAFLRNSIDAKLNQIVENQSSSPANPERHISDYRDNLSILESAKADMILVRSLLAQAKSFPTAVVWRLILAIVIFLGILGVTFYIIWHKQLRTITETIPVSEENTSAPLATEPGQHKAEGEKKPEDKDIENIIKEE